MQTLLSPNWALVLAPLALPSLPGVPKEAEYKRSDANYYWKSDVLKALPGAVLVPAGGYSQRGESYYFQPRRKSPPVIFVEVMKDWVEPITPPDMPASLNIAPDDMQIREPQGDVQVALPSAPADFSPVHDGMSIPNGAVIKTGLDGTAAVLFGGFSSARLMPGSQAAVQQTVTAAARSTEVDLTSGGVFSKVGKQVGVTEDFRVKTPAGTAAAHGTDFATLLLQKRLDVWVAQGTVQLTQTDGQAAGMATAEGAEMLKVARFPAAKTAHETMLADAESLTRMLNFLPLANQKLAALRAKSAGGGTLSDNEQKYLGRIRQVSCLLRLSRVDEPTPVTPAPIPPQLKTPAPAASPAPVTSIASAPEMPSSPASSSTAPSAIGPLATSAPEPRDAATVAMATPSTGSVSNINSPSVDTNPDDVLDVEVRADGKVGYEGSTITLAQFKLRLKEVARVTPAQVVILHPDRKVTSRQIDRVLAVCKAVQLRNTSVASTNGTPPPTPPPPAVTSSASAPAGNLPSPRFLMRPDSIPTNSATPPPGEAQEMSNPATHASGVP